jgi:hypothetical protein
LLTSSEVPPEPHPARVPFDDMTVYGMAAAYSFVQALEHAGRHPTRRSIVAAVERGAVNAPGPALVGLITGPATTHRVARSRVPRRLLR